MLVRGRLDPREVLDLQLRVRQMTRCFLILLGEHPEQFGTELLMVIGFERAHHLLPLDDPSLDIFAFDLEVGDVHDHLREALVRLRIIGRIE